MVKYLMCNSAVPAEAYDPDPSLRVPQLVHPEWEEYPTNSWASSWHWLFRNEPDDDRKFLGWPGRFADVAQYAVNFYSTGDEVLELADNSGTRPKKAAMVTSDDRSSLWILSRRERLPTDEFNDVVRLASRRVRMRLVAWLGTTIIKARRRTDGLEQMGIGGTRI